MIKRKITYSLSGLLVVLALVAVISLPALVQAQEASPQQVEEAEAPQSPESASGSRISFMGPDGNTNYLGINPDSAYGSDQGEHLVVWSGDDTDGKMEIYGRRVSAASGELLGSRINITSLNNTAFTPQRPAVAYYNNTTLGKYLVVWHADATIDEKYEIYGQFVNKTGALDGSVMNISTIGTATSDLGNAAVAYGNDEFLVVWQGDGQDGGLADDENEIYGQIINADGTLTGANFRISTMGPTGNANFDALNPAVAYDSTNDKYTVVWAADNDAAPRVDEEYEIYGQRVNPGGTLDGSRFQISTMGSNGPVYDAYRPDIAYGLTNDDFMVVWTADDNSGGLVDEEFEIYGQRINASNSALVGARIRISTTGPDGNTNHEALDPSVVYAPQFDQYLVVWRGDQISNDREIWGQYLKGVDGSLDGLPWRISAMGSVFGTSDLGADRPAIAFDSASGSALVVWHGDDDTSPLVNDEFEVFGYRWFAGLTYHSYQVLWVAGVTFP